MSIIITGSFDCLFRNNGLVCHFVGFDISAEGITLLTPSHDVFNNMLCICCAYAEAHNNIQK